MAARGEIESRQTPDGVIIVYRPVIVLLPTLFMLFWLAAWLVGERFAFRFVLNPGAVGLVPTVLVTLWLTLWTFAGVAVLLSLLWRVSGSETVKLTGDDLRIGKSLFGVPVSRKHYAVAGISALRVFAKLETDSDNFTSKVNCLAFTFAGKPVAFFRDLDPAEGQKVCDLLAGNNVWLKSAWLKAA